MNKATETLAHRIARRSFTMIREDTTRLRGGFAAYTPADSIYQNYFLFPMGHEKAHRNAKENMPGGKKRNHEASSKVILNKLRYHLCSELLGSNQYAL